MTHNERCPAFNPEHPERDRAWNSWKCRCDLIDRVVGEVLGELREELVHARSITDALGSTYISAPVVFGLIDKRMPQLKCSTCDGTGEVWDAPYNGGRRRKRDQCPDCGGSGVGDAHQP